MASLIAQSWVRATARLVNEEGRQGTGFFVARTASEGTRVFLITNKHVLHKQPAFRAVAPWIQMNLNATGEGGRPKREFGRVMLDSAKGGRLVREHPDPETDVLAIDVGHVFAQTPGVVPPDGFPHSGYFAAARARDALDITIGDEVMTVGYPLGLRQGDTELPLVRQGILATTIGIPLVDTAEDPTGTRRVRTRRAFLIDGACVPGQSGSPVVLKPTPMRLVKGNLMMPTAPPLLLGIVAETTYAPLESGGVGFANLGLAFDAETIQETLDLFDDEPPRTAAGSHLACGARRPKRCASGRDLGGVLLSLGRRTISLHP